MKAIRGSIEIPFVVDGDRSGPPLVFAHGLMGTGAIQRAQLGPLVDAGWTVVTFDQRGHADATRIVDPAGYDPHDMGADLWAVADAAGIERCWIGGGSMGAATSFCAAKAHPERVEGLIQGIPALRDTEHPAVFMFDALADTVRNSGVNGLVEALRTLLKTTDIPIDELFLEQLARHDATSLETALRTVPRWILPDVPSAFGNLPFPVIVLGWGDDPIHPLETARDVASAAGVDLIKTDIAAMQDRTMFGRLLVDALSKVSA